MSLKTQGFWRVGIMFWMLLLLLWGIFLPTASASEQQPRNLGVVELRGTFSDGEFRLTPHHLENLFDLQAVAPGDSWKRTVRVINETDESMDAAVISCTTRDQDTTMFDALIAQITVDDQILYSGSCGTGSEEAPMTEPQVIKSGESLDFEILLTLDPRFGNELQGKSMDSIWDFGAHVHEASSGNDGEADDNDSNHMDAGNGSQHGSNGSLDGGNGSSDGGSDSTDSTGSGNPSGEDSSDHTDASGALKNPSGVKTGVELEDENQSILYILLFVLVGCLVLAYRVLWVMRSVANQKEYESNREEGSNHAEKVSISDSQK